MTKIAIFFVSLIICFSSFVNARELYSEKDKNEIYTQTLNVCIKKQAQDEASSFLKPEVIKSYCQCYAGAFADDLFGNIEFQIALSKNNTEKVKFIIHAESLPERNIPRLNDCFNQVQSNYGGLDKLLKPDVAKFSSTKIGLEGNTRRDFVTTGLHGCVDEIEKSRKFKTSSAENYCMCAANFMADNISIKDVVLTLASGGESPKFNKVANAAAEKCLRKLN